MRNVSKMSRKTNDDDRHMQVKVEAYIFLTTKQI